MLTQLRDIYIHTTCIEIVVINPDSLQGKVALQDFVSMRTKQSQQFRFFGSQFRLFVESLGNLFLAYQISNSILECCSPCSSAFRRQRLRAASILKSQFHTEGLDIESSVSNLETCQNIFIRVFAVKKIIGVSVNRTHFLRRIVNRLSSASSHQIHTQVIFILQESLVSCRHQDITRRQPFACKYSLKHAKIFIIFAIKCMISRPYLNFFNKGNAVINLVPTFKFFLLG